MNKLTGTITRIQKSGSILLVDIDVEEHGFTALLIESTPRHEWLQTGEMIDLVFKETEVSLAKGLSGGISLRNRMICMVMHVERGELLSTVKLKFQKYIIVSAITTRSLDALQIRAGDEIEALVKSNEVSLMKK
jgi:molybdopterin-binding protein